jgi:hypothetical protein
MKLTDTHLVLLSAAARRQDGTVEIGPKPEISDRAALLAVLDICNT